MNLFFYSSLRCTRIRIHIQLFTSLALTCLSWLSWYKLVVGSADVIGENPQWCIMLHIIIQYLMLCNYFWMFCEGVHLHLVLVVVFVKDAVAMKVFRLIGWILPMIFVAAYSFTRKQNEEDSKMYVWNLYQDSSELFMLKWGDMWRKWIWILILNISSYYYISFFAHHKISGAG